MSPSGDPSATQGIPGVNEFVYEAGILEVPLRAEVIGGQGLSQATKEWLEPRLSWTFEPVGDSHDLTPSVPDEQVKTRWCVTGASDQCYGGVRSTGSVTLGASSYKVVLRLEGLPRRYNHFGAKTFTLSFDPFPDDAQVAPYQVGEAVAEIFYYPTDRDHPTSDSIAMTQEDLRVPLEGRDPDTGLPIFLYESSGVEPNWAYDYTQLLQDYYEHELEVRYLREMTDGEYVALAAAPKMSEWVYFGGNPDTVWITDSAFQKYDNAFDDETFGINAFANLLAHEEQHVDDVYVMSDPANCGPYQINSLEPEGVQSGWSFSARGTVISSLHWAFNRYEEKGFPGLYNAGVDVLLDDDGDGVCNNGDQLPAGQSELEVRADSAELGPAGPRFGTKPTAIWRVSIGRRGASTTTSAVSSDFELERGELTMVGIAVTTWLLAFPKLDLDVEATRNNQRSNFSIQLRLRREKGAVVFEGEYGAREDGVHCPRVEVIRAEPVLGPLPETTMYANDCKNTVAPH
ncbi:MAG: hypothetical protein AAF735_08200 [Myxococcota bacterium]